MQAARRGHGEGEGGLVNAGCRAGFGPPLGRRHAPAEAGVPTMARNHRGPGLRRGEWGRVGLKPGLLGGSGAVRFAWGKSVGWAEVWQVGIHPRFANSKTHQSQTDQRPSP